ncbi:MAG: hypothetical protein ACFFHD_00940 [Promethearchaeota archaeon]
MQLVLLYFNSILGPEIFYSYPDPIIEKVKKNMSGFFDLDMTDQFFEVSLVEEELKLTNLYFEITSSWARGHKEMLMLSVITDKNHKSDLFFDILKDYSYKIVSTANMYKAFYTKDFLNKEDPEIDSKKEELHNILIDCYNHLEAKLKSKVENEKIVKKFKKFKW